MTDEIEVRPATRGDLEAVEWFNLKIFSSQSHSAMGRTPVEVQTRVRLALREATGNVPEQTCLAFDGPSLIGIISFETADNRKLPPLRDFWILRPLGLWGAVRLVVVALLSYYPSDPREAYFHGIGVDPAYRRQRVAERLQLAAEQQALRMGKDLAVVLISYQNTPSLNFARKVGFCEVPRRRHFLRTLFLGTPRYARLEKRLTPIPGNGN